MLRVLATAFVSTFALAALTLACGSKPDPVTPKPASTSGTGSAATATSSTAPSAAKLDPNLGPLPPMAQVPAIGVRGSKIVDKRAVPALATCNASGPRKDPAAGLAERVKACAAGASKLSAKSAVLSGEIADIGPAKTHAFRAESGHCYRVYFASDAADAVVSIRDESGDDAGESATGVAPEGGLYCWKSAGNVTLSVAAGTGKGRYAIQVFGD